MPSGSHPDEYAMGIDDSTSHSGTKCGCIQALIKKTSGFGTLMQAFKSDDYRGKRLRLSGWLKTKDVEDWAGIWMRVDGPETMEDSLAFDNMQDRPIKGTTDWSKYEIVLDISDLSEAIAFGTLLSGSGTIWMDNFKFEVVGRDVPTTDERGRNQEWLSDKPLNLDFEQTAGSGDK